MKFKEIDGCPCPDEIYDELVAIRADIRRTKDSSFVYTSIYRGSDPRAQGILKKYGKKSQAFLYRAFWILHLPGYRPANRPGQSTHECFNDGVAYVGPPGMALAGWQVGIDSSSAALFVEAASKRGWSAMVTYPGVALERQHANLKKRPRLVIFKPLRRGAKSPRIASIRKNLAFVANDQGKPYLASAKRAGGGSNNFFDESLYHALRAFQRDHHQKDDGIYGHQTASQLARSVRYRKLKDKK
jgi:hypothetical protein